MRYRGAVFIFIHNIYLFLNIFIRFIGCLLSEHLKPHGTNVMTKMKIFLDSKLFLTPAESPVHVRIGGLGKGSRSCSQSSGAPLSCRSLALPGHHSRAGKTRMIKLWPFTGHFTGHSSRRVLPNRAGEKMKYLESISMSKYTEIYVQKYLSTLQQCLYLVLWCL